MKLHNSLSDSLILVDLFPNNANEKIKQFKRMTHQAKYVNNSRYSNVQLFKLQSTLNIHLLIHLQAKMHDFSALLIKSENKQDH